MRTYFLATALASAILTEASAQIPVPGRIIPLIVADSGAQSALIGRAPRLPRPVAEGPRGATRRRQAMSDWSRSVDFSGPRFGFTYLNEETVDSLKAHHIDVGRMVSQFGWQLEREIHVTPDGPMILNEWVFLAGGLERGAFLPSATWLIGARGKSGNEIGFGPNLSLAGVGLAAAAGITVRNGGMHFPMNVAVASSRTGPRVSFLTGFTLH